jgi:tetratricopeptide (TPR) repeat protein
MNKRIFPIVARFVAACAAATFLLAGSASFGQEPKPAKPATSEQEPPSPERINKLVRDLGNKDYYVRQRAQEELARLGFDAIEALDAASTDDDLEIASRAKYLLRLMRVEWTVAGDPKEVKDCLRNYENMDGDSRENRMQMLARLPDGKGVAALCRLVRFEKSPLLSKTAAAVLVFPNRTAEKPIPATIESIRKNLRLCKRPGAVWLSAWTRLADDPQAAMAEWAKLIDAETALLSQTPEETSPEIVARLTRFQVAWLKKLGRNDEAMNAIRRLVSLNHEDWQSVVQLLEWLIEQKAWKAVDELAQRFASGFASEPILPYMLAQSYVERGEQQRAKETAQRALRMYPGKDQQQLARHFTVAQQLCLRGQIAWARREYEHVIAQGGEGEQLTAISQIYLSEMLHEDGQDLDASEVLGKLAEAIDAGKVAESALYGRDTKELRARRHYFAACHWATKNDVAKQRAALDKALEVDPEELDTLIACYHLPGQPAEFRAKIVKSIKETAVKLHDLIEADPRNAMMYNQYAWLVGNTEGDFDEALKCAQKAVELRPAEGGYFDTLGHVYFGKGDYENAVKAQTRAAELDPRSRIIKVKLDVFRKKLQEQKNKK